MAALNYAMESAMSAVRRGLEPLIPALRRFARALARDAEIADDLVQDTLVRALRAEHLFHGGDLRTWLFTILLNLDRNRRRGLARRPVLAVIEEVEPPVRREATARRATFRAGSDCFRPNSARCCCWSRSKA
jgi:DNA-directed RNA polymerase specialized sigma24 family protein